MTIQAQFLDIKWEISEQKVMGIETINYSFGVNTETKSSSGGNDKVVLKGYKADGITISYKANRMCGVDPEQELKTAEKLLGKKGTFILGEKRLGPIKTMLMSVKPSEVMYNDEGLMIAVTITLTFGEPDEQKSKSSKKGKAGKKATLMDQMKKEKGIKK